MRRLADRAGRTVPALAACVALLSVWDIVVRPALPSALHPAGGLVVAGCTVAIALWARSGRRRSGAVAAPAPRWPALRGARVRRCSGRRSRRGGDPGDATLVPLQPSGHHRRPAAARRPRHDPARDGGRRGAGLPRCPARAAPAGDADGTGGRRVLGPLRTVARPVRAGRHSGFRRPRAGGGGVARSWRPSRRACCSAGCGSDPAACWRRSWLTWRRTRWPSSWPGSWSTSAATGLAPERRAQSVALHQLGHPGRVHEQAVVARQ